MSYFDYHARVKKLIREGHLTSYFFDREYKNIGFALVLCFDQKIYPIREDKFTEYFDLIGKHYKTTQKQGVFFTKFVE